MPIVDIFSKRERRKRLPDILIFDDVPGTLRVQLMRVFVRAIGEQTEPVWHNIVEALRQEWGVVTLANGGSGLSDLSRAMAQLTDIDRLVDIVEICLRVIDFHCRTNEFRLNLYHYPPTAAVLAPDAAIDECIVRMREAGFGYRYVKGEGVVIRVDSEFAHQENVIAPLTLLVDKKFQGAEREFVEAHMRLRHGDFAGVMSEAIKSLESTLKTICHERGWSDEIGKSKLRPEKAALKDLVNYVIKTKGLITSRSQNFFEGLVKTLEDGAGPLRNQAGASHGAGRVPVDIKEYEATYCLGIVGAAIRLLVDAHNAMP